MRFWHLPGLLAAVGPAALGAVPPAAAPAIVTRAPEATAARPTEAEAMEFVRAFSPSDLRRKAELAILEKNFLPGLRASAETAAMLDAFPQLGPELKNALVAQLDLYIEEYDARFFPRAAAIVRESLSQDDVKSLTSFYKSPLGQKMLILATDHVDAAELVERVAKEQPIDEGVTTRQAFRAGIRTLGQLNEAERAEILELNGTPAGRHFDAVMPKLSALQTELMNDPGPRFTASSEKAMNEAFKRVTGMEPGASD